MLTPYAALLILHLLAAAYWVGGMALMHTVVRPTAVALLAPPQRLPFLSAALGRFFVLAGVAIAVLLLSGVAMVEIAGGFAVVRRSVHAMFGIGLVMVAIYAHLRWRLHPRLRRAVEVQDWAGAGAQLALIRQQVFLNLGLGIAVFLVAVLGRMG
jgi:uncharacterized membrane protein